MFKISLKSAIRKTDLFQTRKNTEISKNKQWFVLWIDKLMLEKSKWDVQKCLQITRWIKAKQQGTQENGAVIKCSITIVSSTSKCKGEKTSGAAKSLSARKPCIHF